MEEYVTTSCNRFFIHDVNTSEASLTKLENSFILISLNRFQQIIGVHTLQAFSEQIKVDSDQTIK